MSTDLIVPADPVAASETLPNGFPAPEQATAGPAEVAPNEPSTPKYIKIIEPPSGWPSLNLKELWHYRDLLFMLIWRDISANYRQSVIAGMQGKPGIPYPLLIFVGLLPWMYFAGCLGGSSNSVVGSSGLLTKVYFPRLILPLTSLGSGLVDFSIQFVLLLAVLPFFIGMPGWTILLAPLFVLACMFTALSVGLWCTALNVKYRDIGQMVPFVTQLWMWLTPVYYLSDNLRSKMGDWGWLVGLNPMAGVVEGFRWAMLGSAPSITPPDWTMMAVSFIVVAVLFVSGLYYFRRLERTFADLI
jgi:lipopolysaccharide transport system permease protein